MTKKVISVVGATGNQGGALVQAIIKDGTFTARALTRDPTSAKSEELKKAGAEVVKADTSDVAALTEAVKGSYGMFCATALDLSNPQNEINAAQAMATAAEKAGIQHVVWSTLEDTRLLVPLSSDSMPTLHGHYKVPHFDAKGESDKFFAKLPTTYLLTSFFFENFIGSLGVKAGADGQLAINLPCGERRMAGVSTEDIGRTALGIFKRPDLIGKRVGLMGDALTGAQYAAGFSKVLGKPVTYNAVPFEVFRKFGFPGADDLGNMFQYYHDQDVAFIGARSNAALLRELNPELMNFEQWLNKNKDKLKV